MSARRLPTRIVSASIALAIALGFVWLTAAPAQAATALVTDEATLRAAILDPTVDVIEFDPAVDVADRHFALTADLPLIDDRDVEILGNGWTINGNPAGLNTPEYSGFVVVDHAVTFSDINIRTTLEWGIVLRGPLADVTIEDSTFYGIRALPDIAGNLAPSGAVMLADCTSSSAQRLSISGSTFTVNHEAIDTPGCSVTLSVTDSVFNNNFAVMEGPLNGVMNFSGIDIRSGSYGIFGNILEVDLTISDSILFGDTQALGFIPGGDGTVLVERSTISGSDDGVWVQGALGSGAPDLTFIDTVFNFNNNGIRITQGMDGDLSLIRTTFNDQLSALTGDSGAPAVMNGDLLIQDSHFVSNGIEPTIGKSVNVQFNADAAIVGSTFENETRQAIALTGGSPSAVATIENSTVTGLISGAGGDSDHAISVSGAGQFALRHSTVTNNEADSAVRIAGDIDAGISHSVIAGNTAANSLSVEGTATANVDWSILGAVSDTSTGGGYIAVSGVTTGVTDPELAPLADNGGTTFTHLPLTGSPAVDAGNPAIVGAPAFDQRGLARIAGARIDIGSVEVAAPVVPVAPTVSDPADATVVSGATATFSVTTTGVPTPSVAWQVSTDGGTGWGALTAGMTASTDGLTLSVVTTAARDGYQFRATASNGTVDAVSAAAELTVTPPLVAPTVTGLPDVSVISGTTATFSATVTGYPAPTMTWEVARMGGGSWGPITDDMAATVASNGLSISVVTTDGHDGYLYRVTATNSEGFDESDPGLLTVMRAPAAPTITDPADATVVSGATATFAVTVTGLPGPAVSWQVSTDSGTTWQSVFTDSSAIVASDELSVTVTTTDAHNGNLYRAIASNSQGSDASQPALLTVTPPPVAPTIAGLMDATVVSGETATFSVTTTGVPTPAVEWNVSTDGGLTWGAITDAAMTVSLDGLTLSVMTSDAFDGYQFRATATNGTDPDTSATAVLTVTPVAPTPTPTPTPGGSVLSLVNTGSELPVLAGLAGLIVLLLGGGLIAANSIARRRTNAAG